MSAFYTNMNDSPNTIETWMFWRCSNRTKKRIGFKTLIHFLEMFTIAIGPFHVIILPVPRGGKMYFYKYITVVTDREELHDTNLSLIELTNKKFRKFPFLASFNCGIISNCLVASIFSIFFVQIVTIQFDFYKLTKIMITESIFQTCIAVDLLYMMSSSLPTAITIASTSPNIIPLSVDEDFCMKRHHAH